MGWHAIKFINSKCCYYIAHKMKTNTLNRSTYEGHSENKGNFFKSKINSLSEFFSMNINSALFEVGLQQKLFWSYKNIYFGTN